MDDIVVLCDFDGTISVKDVTDSLLERFANPEWEEIEEAWKEGLISSQECMAEQYGLIKASREELEVFLGKVEIDPYFPEFLRFCNRFKHRFAVVSDGFDFYIERILKRYGLQDVEVFANHLEWAEDGIKTFFPHTNDECPTCGNCKTNIFHSFKGPRNHVVYIGDGWSDRCIARESDTIFAKGKLIAFCHENSVPYIPYLTFADILKEMSAW